MGHAFKRRNYFINKELQGKYIFQYFLLVAFGSLLFAVVFCFFSSNTLSIVYKDYHLQLGTTPGILFSRIINTQWVFILVGGSIMVLITLLLTHRIAGPFYRFERTLDLMNQKDLSQSITLRNKDEGKELAQKINSFNLQLSHELNQVMENSEQIKLVLNSIELPDDSSGNLSQLQTRLDQIDMYNQKTMMALNKFNLNSH